MEEFFDTSHSSEEALYDAVAPVNLCVFSCPCMKHEDYQEITNYTIFISALKCKKVKEMKVAKRTDDKPNEL